ncbi:MAG TPA: class I SAM-dependent methyltransferase, partial [Sulfurimonas autotrophica]|nr:class I SAM-dependent methyltransferase [Sulfurimonas autotrophica]
LESITTDERSIFHNADIYPPHYNSVNSVTWVATEEATTEKKRLQEVKKFYPLEMYALWAVSSTPFGPLRREHLYDRLIFAKKRVFKRNYEASYDVAELEPLTRKNSTYVLQEYFIPKENAEMFIEKVAKVFREYEANILNISIRHSVANEDSLLSWSRSEVLAFVVYYKQGTSQKEKDAVAVWTRKAIEVVIEEQGAYYLPYQPHATKEQLLQAYPNFEKFAQKKRKYDKNYKFRNALFDKYIYGQEEYKRESFYDVLHDDVYKDMFYDFLRFVFRTDEKEVFSTVLRAMEKYDNSDDIYRYIQSHCKLSAKVLLKPKSVRNILQQILVQKRTIREQTQQLVDRDIYDMLLIEPTDIKSATKHYSANDPLPLEKILGFSLAKPKAEYFIKPKGNLLGVLDQLQNGSFDLITVYGGLHHLPKETRSKVHEKIYALLKNGGSFVLREHDVQDEEMFDFVSLIHAVFNAVTGESLESEKSEVREFESIETIVKDIEEYGFTDSKQRARQYGDPSANILLCFHKLEKDA